MFVHNRKYTYHLNSEVLSHNCDELSAQSEGNILSKDHNSPLILVCLHMHLAMHTLGHVL